jgi:hypothetical protein
MISTGSALVADAARRHRRRGGVGASGIGLERGPLARHPLKDKRVVIEVGDVAATLGASRGRFDAVLLDVDNGPAAFTASRNADLYDDHRLAAALGA